MFGKILKKIKGKYVRFRIIQFDNGKWAIFDRRGKDYFDANEDMWWSCMKAVSRYCLFDSKEEALEIFKKRIVQTHNIIKDIPITQEDLVR